MIKAIEIRDLLIALLQSSFPDLVGKVVSQKRDVVESHPSAAVYLGDIDNEPITMRGGFQREISINIEIYRNQANLETVFMTAAGKLEQDLYAIRKGVSGVKTIYISNVAAQYEPNSKATTGALMLSITASTSKQLTN